MKIYLASRYSTKDEIRGYTKALEDLGFVLTSSWPREPHDPNMDLPEVSPRVLRRLAARDLREIQACDLLVLFTVSPLEATKRGGRHTEFGIALALKKRMVICGPHENIFHYLPNVVQCGSFAALKQLLLILKNAGQG